GRSVCRGDGRAETQRGTPVAGGWDTTHCGGLCWRWIRAWAGGVEELRTVARKPEVDFPRRRYRRTGSRTVAVRRVVRVVVVTRKRRQGAAWLARRLYGDVGAEPDRVVRGGIGCDRNG